MTKAALTLMDASKLPMRPLQTASLSSQERARHRAEIGSTVESMLASWFTPAMSDAAHAAYLMDWTDTLEGFTPGQVRKAFSIYRDDSPDKRPNASHIKAILAVRWGRHVVAQLRELPKPDAETRPAGKPQDAGRRAEVVAELVRGAAKKIGGDA